MPGKLLKTGCIGILMCALLLTACGKNGSSDNQTTSGSDKQITVGVAMPTLRHQFYIDMNTGIEKAAKENGIKLLTNDPNLEINKQVAGIEDFIEKKVDAMIVIGTDSQAIVPALEEAKAKGIPIITADLVINSDKIDTFIGTENYKAGVELGNYLKKEIESSGQPAKIGVITRVQSMIQQERLRGFKEALKDVKGVTILNEQPGYQREDSLNVVENMIQANPDLKYVYATAEGSVLGALAALQSTKNEKIKIVGFDVTKEAADGIKSGMILGMIQQQPTLIGESAVKAVNDILSGKAVDKQIDTPVILMDKANVGEYFK
ncbi:substrate-binding domain-containing protein [Paenibacillus eucommiae]|uniref:Ribose transport system substrate-binding protein n=1 Tax=Paenibacillus eucommiae TaxID=1355755 RepID=A0ABS4J4M5_9BACL|nr:substrate-binding domain-containing protein [Paenibacillus eucommiae]MBP1993734.1 ribose transport system substrate-binding protein [Paenibacillus eucommiae]